MELRKTNLSGIRVQDRAFQDLALTPAFEPMDLRNGRLATPALAPARTEVGQPGLSSVYDIVRFGACGNGTTPSTDAIQSAIDVCAADGGGIVWIPAGQFVTGALWLRDHVTLHLVAGATLVASESLDDFPPYISAWEGPLARPMHSGIINGEGLRNVTLTGRGTLDGRGNIWWERFRQDALTAERPRLVRLVDCQNVQIDGLTFVNSPMWTINPLACDNVMVSRVTIRNPEDSPNTDGINPESCSNVHVSDCHIDVGDDCIAIKAGTEEDGRRTPKACENVTIVNCTMLHGHGGVVIGSEITGGIRNIAISNCIFNGTDRGIRIKARRGRGYAVEDVRVDNIVMDRVLCPVVVNLFYFWGVRDARLVNETAAMPVTAATPSFRRFRFSNISARRVRSAAAYILGLPERGVEDVVFNNVSVYLDEDADEAVAPAMSPITPPLCRAGFRIKHVQGLRLRAVDVHNARGETVVLDHVSGATLRDLTPGSGKPATVRGSNASDVRVDETIEMASAD